MKTNPLVSVCLPTYNGEEFLQETLDSIVNQTYKNIELIVSDDASSDSTLKIIHDFRNSVSFPCQIYNHTPNGIAENWNNTLRKSNGKYIKFVFQDDLLNPTCIEKMVTVLERDAQIGLVTCKRRIITAEDNRFTQGFISNFNNLQVNIPLENRELTVIKGRELLKAPYFKKKPINSIGEPITVLFRAKMITDIGYFDTRMFQLVDFEYWLRMFKKYKIAFLKEELVQFRLHNTQASFVNHQVNSNDKEIYYKLLYTKYFWLLHINFKWNLVKRFHWSFKMYRFLKSIFIKKEDEVRS